MTNKEISKYFKLAGQLMELHGEQPFKVKSYQSAAFRLSRIEKQLAQLHPDEMEQIDGIGKSLAAKIAELLETGKIVFLDELIARTPVGVIDMLSIKGIGPKKVHTLWKELDIETVGELLYACNENRLLILKGFGEKTQSEIQKSIEFQLANSGKALYAAVEDPALNLLEMIRAKTSIALVEFTGEMRRKCEIIETLEIIAGAIAPVDLSSIPHKVPVPVKMITCPPENFYRELMVTTGSISHLQHLKLEGTERALSEEEIYKANGFPFIVPELREGLFEYEWIKGNNGDSLIELSDLKGILHNHTTWSDGAHTLREMAEYCRSLGYEYLGICDHSKSAVYANGLSPERVVAQQKEMDILNNELAPFRIFKGIESDILSSGALDYNEDTLKIFDFVVASVHSALKMDEERATKRLITAIENPFTTILGHPTGRLLLSRPGYPVNHRKIIDACAANGVVIELNANPFRLDIDWRWIQYALEKGVKISINPDAHYKEKFADMYFGVCVARKGGLTKEMTFNTFSREKVESCFRKAAVGAADKKEALLMTLRTSTVRPA